MQVTTSEVKLVDKPPHVESLTTRVARYRDSMAWFLRAALALMDDVLSPVDLGAHLDTTAKSAFEEDPLGVFRVTSHLLTKKARFHVMAVLSANEAGNIHSLAVQIRPALECSGQVVTIFGNLFDKQGGAEAVGQYLDADYYHTVKRLAKGHIVLLAYGGGRALVGVGLAGAPFGYYPCPCRRPGARGGRPQATRCRALPRRVHKHDDAGLGCGFHDLPARRHFTLLSSA